MGLLIGIITRLHKLTKSFIIATNPVSNHQIYSKKSAHAAVTKPLIPAERRKRIQDYLSLHQVAQSAVLSEMLNVSEATTRRDLDWMEAQGLVERTHGGARLSQRMRLEPAYSSSAQSHPTEKYLIGQMAAQLIEDGDTIFVNSGTTTTQVVRHIPPHAKVTLITNNVTAALEAQSAHYEIILLGGSFRAIARSVVGRFAAATLRQVYASKAFIGTDGLSAKHGCTTPTSAEAEITQLMIERTRGPVIVVADSSKWGVVSNYELATLDQLHTLVTDAQLDAAARAELTQHTIEVLIATRSGGSVN